MAHLRPEAGGLSVLSGSPVEIVGVIRRMRGGSQSFLVRGSDGASYVAKFANNPQGNRTLINECIAGHLLSALGVATPKATILRLDNNCKGREELYFSMDRRVPIVSGLHLGLKCPVDPDTVAILDFLPRNLASRVANCDDLGVVFAFDQWVAHDDRRQFIFARQSIPLKAPRSKQRNGSFLTAWAIDNGRCFGGNWTFMPKRLYADNPILDIYSYCDVGECAARNAQLIYSLPASALEEACRNIPGDWFGIGDDTALNAMLSQLQQRQRLQAKLIHEHVAAIRAPRKLAS
jgi:hypothetical protein